MNRTSRVPGHVASAPATHSLSIEAATPHESGALPVGTSGGRDVFRPAFGALTQIACPVCRTPIPVPGGTLQEYAERVASNGGMSHLRLILHHTKR